VNAVRCTGAACAAATLARRNTPFNCSVVARVQPAGKAGAQNDPGFQGRASARRSQPSLERRVFHHFAAGNAAAAHAEERVLAGTARSRVTLRDWCAVLARPVDLYKAGSECSRAPRGAALRGLGLV
jgi:hypothetical protein